VKNFKKFLMIAMSALAMSGLAFSQTVFTVVKVPQSSPNSLVAINNAGQVIVNIGNSGSYQIAVWNRITGFQNIGLNGTSGGTAINKSGDVVGAANHQTDLQTNLQAFLWKPTKGVQWLGSLGGGLSAATGINSANGVVGFSYTPANMQHAFLWTQAGGMQDLMPTLTSVGGGAAEAINSSSEVVGYYYPTSSGNTLGFTWTRAGGLQNLGVPGTLAYAVNDAGMVVGQSLDANGNRHAFSWTQTGAASDLGTLGGAASSALSINNHGWIVGTSLTTSGNGLPHGFLWTPSGGMQDFVTLAGLSSSQQTYSDQVNDLGVVALSTNKGDLLLVPKMVGTFTSSVNPSKLGQPVTFTATISSIAGPPPDGETVQFVVSGKILGTATLSGGVAKFTTSAIPVGPHAVVANYSGDANYLPAKYTALTQVVNK
jgi:probable HAF family extracellular repeat protein